MSLFGKNLKIAIVCSETILEEWTTFVSWYSIYKVLPEAEVAIFCLRKGLPFNWIPRLGIKMYRHHNPPKDFLVINSFVMAIRNLEELKIIDAKSEEISTFCSYNNGCGDFVIDRWINKTGGPLSRVRAVVGKNLTINEKKISEIWRKSFPLYQFVT